MLICDFKSIKQQHITSQRISRLPTCLILRAFFFLLRLLDLVGAIVKPAWFGAAAADAAAAPVESDVFSGAEAGAAEEEAAAAAVAGAVAVSASAPSFSLLQTSFESAALSDAGSARGRKEASGGTPWST